MSKFPLIVFEGIDGTGKSYHINKVQNYLKKKKIKCFILREPGGSKNSEIIRKIILQKNNIFNKETDLFLYIASRSENIAIIKEKLKKKVVLIDRFADSTLAYQHYGQKINLKLINYLNNFLLKGLSISHTFLLTIDKKNLKKRLNLKNKNRYDSFNIKFYSNVQNGYIKLYRKNLKKYTLIDANLHKNINEKIILNKISKIVKK